MTSGRRPSVGLVGAIAPLLALLTAMACASSGAPSAPAKPAARPPEAAAQSAVVPPAVAPTVSSASAPAPPDGLQKLVDAARQEGQLNLVWAESVLGGSQMLPRIAEGFNKLYGLNVSVQHTAGPNMAEFGIRLAQEHQANRPATTDAYVGSARAMVGLMQVDALLPEDWTSWASNVRNAALVAPGAAAVEIGWFQPGITYNTSKVAGAAVPTSLEDLLKPEYRGRIASTPYAAFWESLASPEVWGEQRTLDYITRFAGQLAGLMGCGEAARLVSGEFDLLALDCGSFDARTWSARGAPLAQAVPSDAGLVFPWYVAVPKNAAHPSAGKLFANYLLSREGQDVLYETHYADHPLVQGSKLAPELDQLRASGTRLVSLDVAFRQRNDEKELDRILAEIQAILRGR